MKDIITDIEKLSTRADEIDVRKENKLMREIITEIKKVIREKNLASLSAPQIGYDKRIFVINFNGDLRSYVNPIISEANSLTIAKEACSSIPGKLFIRPRHPEIVMMYTTPLGKIESTKFLGAAAIKAQHCIDHLDGLLLSDIGLEIEDDFFDAPEEERLEVINAYIDSLDIRRSNAEDAVKEDEMLAHVAKDIDFNAAVARGEVQVETIQISKEIENDSDKTNSQ